MLPRSAAGRSIAAAAEGRAPALEQTSERTVTLLKKTVETLVGVRFGLHPVTGQVVINELYSGYPAQECGRIFTGDVLVAVNGVRVTEVDMATQLIKLAPGKVDLRLANVYTNYATAPSQKSEERRAAAAVRW